MQNILIVFFVICLIIMILAFPFKTRFMGHFNLIDFVGFYSIKVLKIKLLNGKVCFIDGKIYVENSFNFIEQKMNKSFLKHFYTQVLKRMEVKKVEVFFNGGVAENSFSSAMMCGSVNSIVEIMYSFLSQNYFNVKLYEDIDAKFGKDEIELTFDIVISINFLSLIIAIVSALKKSKGELENERS